MLRVIRRYRVLPLPTTMSVTSITLEDLVGTVEIIIFPKDYERYAKYLENDAKVFVEGRVTAEEDRNGKLICEKIISFDEVKRELWLQFQSKSDFVCMSCIDKYDMWQKQGHKEKEKK